MKVKSIFTIALFQISFIFSLLGQTNKTMTIVDFLSIPSLSNSELSNDGHQVIYQLASSDWKENKQISHIWKKDLETNQLIQLTNSVKGENNPMWSPDGKYILFTAKRDGAEETQAYLINPNGGEAQQLTKHKTAVKNVQWSSDGQSVYFLSSDAKTKEQEKKDKLKDDVFAFDENYEQVHLWHMGIRDSEAKKITDGDFSVNSYEISRDGKTIIFNKAVNPLLGYGHLTEIWSMNADGSNAKQLTFNTISESDARLSPDGKQILFTASTNEKFEQYYNSNLFILPASGGNALIPIKNNKYEVTDAQWSADGKSIYLLLNMGVESQLFTFNLSDSKLTQITSGQHSISKWNYNYKLDQHLIGINNSKNAGDLYLMQGINFKSAKKITEVYDYLDKEFLLPQQGKISWKGADGVIVEGLVIYPIGYKAGVKYPLVVQTHGGPAASDQYGISLRYTHYHAVLAGMGYIILLPNYRGSTGYGNDFFRDMVGSYFRNAHLDVMKGVDFMIENGWVDGDKMVKMGWSAGGHMTNKIITFTNRFKAASSGAGAVNWISMYSQSDVRNNRTPWFGGTPWQKNAPIDVYWNNSPLKDIHKVKTPTLIFVGASDDRVPPPQSVELYRALTSLKVPTHLYMAPREPHGWGELRHRLFKVNAEIEWFNKYALNKTYDWEKAPGDDHEKE